MAKKIAVQNLIFTMRIYNFLNLSPRQKEPLLKGSFGYLKMVELFQCFVKLIPGSLPTAL